MRWRRLHYLIKPITMGNVEDCFNRLERAKKHHPRKRPSISIVSDYRTVEIPVENIQYAEVKGNTVTIHLSGRSVSSNISMTSFEKKVGDAMIRCHRSYLVNPAFIERIDNNDFVLRSGARVPIRMNGHRRTISLYHDWLAKQADAMNDARR